MQGPERVAMLNACARWFFGSTRRLLIREVLLGIARLTDTPRIGAFDNLTVAILLRDPALKGQARVRARLRRRIASAIKIAQPIRTHRNKHIAHLDHALVQGATTIVLPKVPSGTVSKVLRALAAAYNEHGRSVLNTDTSFELRPLGSVDALIRILESSERWAKFQTLNNPKTST